MSTIPTPTRHSRFRLAAMDLDDTLLGPDKRISAENVAAVQALIQKGVRVVLASGRKHESMLRFHRELGLEGLVVSCQGAMVKNAETNEVLHQHHLAADHAAELVSEVIGQGGTLAYYHPDAIYVSHRNQWTDLYQSRGGDPIIVHEDLNALAGQNPLKIIWLDAPAQTAARFADARVRYRDRFELVITSPEYLEFNALGISKAVGLARVAEHYGIAPSEVLAFGDGDNDISMLAWAGESVAMSISSTGARAAATHVAAPGRPETSLARAVERFL